MEWYVNFADADLFVAYHIGLFAQDEIQTAEHPACGAIKEWMKAVGTEDKVRLLYRFLKGLSACYERFISGTLLSDSDRPFVRLPVKVGSLRLF